MKVNKAFEYINNNIEYGVAGLDILCGEYISSGTYRDVYQCVLFDNWVVKIDRSNSNSNILEFETWDLVKRTKHRKWFAPCAWISSNGKILLQQKTKPITDNKILPKKIPAYLSDVRIDNLGLIDGKLVTHDYSFTIDQLFKMKGNKKKVKLKLDV